MRVSIITATFNSAHTIADCIASVNHQTYPDIEHIVIDGGSTDHTLQIIEKTPNRIAKLVSEPDNGIYDALNKGIQLATGDIIGFLHADDLFAADDIVARLAHVFEKHSIPAKRVTSGVYGNLVYVNRHQPELVIRYWKSKPFHRKYLQYGWMPAHPTLFLRRDVYQKHGTFNASFKIAADYDFMLRILRDKSLHFEYLPEVISKMRVGGASNKNLRNLAKKSHEDLKAMKNNKIRFRWLVLFFKNIRKLSQFFHRTNHNSIC
jgi:glycosyltransferase involved in cell wall biosynthesis